MVRNFVLMMGRGCKKFGGMEMIFLTLKGEPFYFSQYPMCALCNLHRPYYIPS